jgi:hypothetical protein
MSGGRMRFGCSNSNMRVFILLKTTKQIEALTNTLEDREKATRRLEREIKNARVGGLLAHPISNL